MFEEISKEEAIEFIRQMAPAALGSNWEETSNYKDAVTKIQSGELIGRKNTFTGVITIEAP